MGKINKWTPQELEVLEAMYGDPDYTIEAIVETLGRSYNAVVLMASRQGFKRPETYVKFGLDTGIMLYDPKTNTLTISGPVDIEDILDRICEIKMQQARTGEFYGE